MHDHAQMCMRPNNYPFSTLSLSDLDKVNCMLFHSHAFTLRLSHFGPQSIIAYT